VFLQQYGDFLWISRSFGQFHYLTDKKAGQFLSPALNLSTSAGYSSSTFLTAISRAPVSDT
jgi:hypothetical protein